jgi:hypothetical protein
MRFIILFLKTLFFLVIVCIFVKSWHLVTDGFRLDKINYDLKGINEDIIKFDEKNNIFDQKFKYLSKGCQTYVFESEDKNYVIKFIRYHRYKIPFWLKVLDFFGSYKNLRQFYKEKLLNNSLDSYQIAYKYLRNETGVIYVHLSRTTCLNKKIQIIDRLNHKYLIDLDKTGFLVQKKVENFQDFLDKNKNNHEELKRITGSFLQTTRSIYLKGFNNDDYNCIKNSGIIDNKVIHSDVGSFLERNLNEKKAFENEFNHFMIYFKKWALKNAPFLIAYVDDEIKKMSSEL